MDVLVIDIGGSHVKFSVKKEDSRRFVSGDRLSPAMLVQQVRHHTHDWTYDVISLGFPGVVGPDGPKAEPGNLGDGWIGFDFGEAFGKPVRVVNDAVLQALGAYDGGRMLFLGLGTGLGSTLVTEHVVIPLELGNLPFRDGDTMAERLGRQGLEDHGHAVWTADVQTACSVLQSAFAADYLVLGGGNVEKVESLPAGVRRGGNDDAFAGGFRLWEEMIEPHDREPHRAWRVVR
jgi:polyphosphate glucokinase